MDEDLTYCLSQWGEPTQRIKANNGELERMQPHVPAKLIEYWREIGFSTFKNGLMMVTNPLEWQDTVTEWIAGTELETLDTYIALFRGAFGDITLFGLRYGCSAIIRPNAATYVGSRDKAAYGLETAVRSMFGNELSQYDTGDKSLNFAKALKKLGPLKPNEMYGFVPVLPMGGIRDLAHLQKVDAFAHLSILRQATGDLRGIMEYADIYR